MKYMVCTDAFQSDKALLLIMLCNYIMYLGRKVVNMSTELIICKGQFLDQTPFHLSDIVFVICHLLSTNRIDLYQGRRTGELQIIRYDDRMLTENISSLQVEDHQPTSSTQSRLVQQTPLVTRRGVTNLSWSWS